MVSKFFRAIAATGLIFLPALSLASEDPALIDVKKLVPGIIVEMRYATTDNFTKTQLYPVAQCLLCEPAAKRLARVQQTLEHRGLGLKIWDCYRPLSVQKKLWALVPDDRYVANPAKGSKHNRGASVDLTLVDKNGKELLMPTPFDEFTDKAHRDFMKLPSEAIKNRATLQVAMENEGFIPLPTEWWHFDDPKWMDYSLRDEPLGSASLGEDVIGDGRRDFLTKDVKQLVIVTSKGWDATTAVLQRYEKHGFEWNKAGESWPVNLGEAGMAWGRGLHSLDQNGPVKREGDNNAPAGVFRIGKAYGPSQLATQEVRWPYQPIDEKWFCVDDPASSSYNRIIKLKESSVKDWSSAEDMKRKDSIYNWVINIEQNYPDIKAGCGSCVFFHVWRKEGSPTEGCTAMSEANILKLLGWMKPTSYPLLIQLPKDTYEKLKDAWRLP